MTADLLRELRALDLYWAWGEAKNCGTGAGGFQPGNTCGRAGSPAGSERRRAAGRDRQSRRRGPDSGLDAGERGERRRKAGRRRKARMEWQAAVAAGGHGAEHRDLLKAQRKERVERARAIKDERKEQRKDQPKEVRDTLRDVRKERKALPAAQAKERKQLKARQAKEGERLGRSQARERERLEARHAKEREKHGEERVAKRHGREREELAAQHAEEGRGLAEDQREERQALRRDQQSEREDQREAHRDAIATLRRDQREARDDLAEQHREAILEEHATHREELARLHRDDRYERHEAARGKALGVMEGEVEGASAVPARAAILARALDATGHADAFSAGTLDGRQHLDVLHAVRLEGRRWLREQAEALLDDVSPMGEKALFGGVKAKVGAFFDRAKRYVRELFAAGVLAVAGPDPGVLDEPAVQEAMAEQVDRQMAYMEAFQDRIVSEARPLGPAFVANAEQYGQASWGVVQSITRAYAASVFALEKSNHDKPWTKKDPCDQCRHEAEQPWAPVGSRVPVGARTCLASCHCFLTYRLSEDDHTEYLAPGRVYRRAA